MKIKIEKYAPPGFNVKMETGWIIMGYVLSVLYSCIAFMFKFFLEYRRFFRNDYGIYTEIPSGVMPSCAHLLEGIFFGFWVLVVILFVVCVLHYVYYFVGAKSIYTMKRLPNRLELLKRNLTIPFMCIVIILITVFLLIVIYYVFYMAVAPKNCIYPNQWLRIWRLIK